MFTVCPKCALTLVVTAADLRVAQGFVRCGRCSNVFNALARLSEDRAAATSSQPALTPPPTPPPPPPAPREDPPQTANQALSPEDPDIPESALEFNPAATDVSKVFVQPPPNPEWQAATGTFKALVLDPKKIPPPSTNQHAASSANRPSDNAQVDVELDSQLLGDTSRMRRPEFPKAGASTAASPSGAHSSPPPPAPQETARVAASAPAAETSPGNRPTGPARSTGASSPPVETRPASAQVRGAGGNPALANSSLQSTAAEIAKSLIRPRRDSEATASTFQYTQTAPFWSIGTGVLVVVLMAQIIHHFRNDLATISWVRAPLTAIYATLGAPLVPKWNVAAYEVRQLGASTDADRPGQITVRTSVKNRGQPRPFPLLRVTLQDRFGNRIAARDVPPASYLPRAVAGASFMATGQRIDAEMTFVDPGSSAVGFEVDACLPYPGGGVNCANDAATP